MKEDEAAGSYTFILSFLVQLLRKLDNSVGLCLGSAHHIWNVYVDLLSHARYLSSLLQTKLNLGISAKLRRGIADLTTEIGSWSFVAVFPPSPREKK